jgi:uncharacterized protein
MFKRRHPLPLIRRVWEFVWPSAGWRRTARYVIHRLGRVPGTPYRIAAGFACGAAVSFTPFMGFHFLCAALLALLIRGSVVASAFGTAVGNFWTFPFIWIWTYNLGRWLLGDAGNYQLPEHLSVHYIINSPFHVVLTMTVGGLPTGVVAWFAFFWPARAAVLQIQRRRRRRLRRRVMKKKRKNGTRLYADQRAENEV